MVCFFVFTSRQCVRRSGSSGGEKKTKSWCNSSLPLLLLATEKGSLLEGVSLSLRATYTYLGTLRMLILIDY
jgi:hypothetical protein